MSEPLGDNGRITFTVKELLAKVDAKLDVIVGRLDEKADAHDLERLEERVVALEGSAASSAQLAAYRAQQAGERKRDRRWTIGFAITTLLAVAGLGLTAISNLVS